VCVVQGVTGGVDVRKAVRSLGWVTVCGIKGCQEYVVVSVRCAKVKE